MATCLTEKPHILADIEARCTALASEALMSFSEDPRFFDVLKRLQGIPGTIYRGDVEMFVSLATAKARMNRNFIG
jgi:hypothetical protein